MGMNKKNQFLTKVLFAYQKKATQKDIARQFGLTEKTVGSWLKEHKAKLSNNKESIKELRTRLKYLLNDRTAQSEDIKNLTIAIEKLENIWFNKLKM